MGSAIEYSSATQLSGNFLAINSSGSSTITSLNSAIAIVPKSNGFQTAYSGVVNIGTFITPGTISLSANHRGACIVSGGNTTIVPGLASLVLVSNVTASTINMNNGSLGGNVLIGGSSTDLDYTMPSTYVNTLAIAAGSAPVVPTMSHQITSNAQSYLSPFMPQLFIPFTNPNAYPLVFDSATGLIGSSRGTLGAVISRTERGKGTTGAGGTFSVNYDPLFTIGLGTTASIQLTVQNTSTTVHYSAQVGVIDIPSNTFQVLVFQSINAVAGSPTMVPAGIGITVHYCVSY